ncbi:MAG TPA: YqaJ viral recombinase family protein, partial [Methylophilaceae bacterium]|nr:YqaJ viral recombinase family protein [Methylophilaceae bacterium]
MKIIDFPQGTLEWLKARAGMVTASRIADVVAKTKTGESASRANYRAQIVAERLSGQPQESYTNDAMRWGIDTEPLARSAYEAHTGDFVEQIGLVLHPEIEWAGASPDGLAGGGLLEIKCPNTATHIDYLLNKVPPTKYRPQMAWQCACTEREWVDFVSYDPRLPEKHQLFVV